MLLVYTLIGILIVSYLMKKRYEYGLYFLIIAVTLVPKVPLIKISGTYIPVRFEDFLIFTVALFTLYSFVNNKESFKTPLNKWLLIFLSVGLLSTIVGMITGSISQPMLGLLHYARRIEYISLFFITIASLKDLQQIKNTIRIMIITSLVVLVYGALQGLNLVPLFSSMNNDNFLGKAAYYSDYGRIISTFSGPYDFAIFMALIVILALVMFLQVKTYKTKVFYVFLMIAGLFFLYKTYSRTPLIALVAGVLVVFVSNRLWKWLVPAAILALSPVIFFKNLLTRLTSTGNLVKPSDVTYEQAMTGISKGFDMSAYVRFTDHWPKALNVFLHHPLLGAGYSVFGEAVDGDYVRMLGETGLLGLISFVILTVVILKNEINIIKTTRDIFIKQLTIGIMAITTVLLLDALFIDIFEASKIAIYFWILTGITFKISQLQCTSDGIKNLEEKC